MDETIENQMLISQQSTDMDHIYEFNGDDDLEELNGFKLTGSNRNQIDHSYSKNESVDFSTYSTNETIEDQMIISQQSTDMDHIYEFNGDDDLEELNGFKLIGLNRNLIDHCYSKNESVDFSTCSINSSSLNSTQESISDFNPNYADLNDYVLFDIFKLLSLIELQQCRIVCKRFRALIDKIQLKKLSLTYFKSKHSWSSNENYSNLQRYPDSIDVKKLNSFDEILNKPQFKDLEHLVLITDYTVDTIDETFRSEIFELDLSNFSKLKRLEIFGSYISLKKDQICESLVYLSIEHVTVDLIKLFPKLLHLKTNVLNSNLTSSNLEQLEFFNSERELILNQENLYKLCPNLKSLSCYFLNAYGLLGRIDKIEDLLFKQLKMIKIHFNNFLSHENLIDLLIQKANNLSIKLEFHVNENKNKAKAELIKWNKLFQIRQIDTFFYGNKKVNLRDFFLLPNYENNTLLRQTLKVDNHTLGSINDKVYQYLFNTHNLELNSSKLEDKFNYLLKTIPSITKLTINCRLKQSTFDKFKLYCPFLSHLYISSNQAYKLNLNFIHYLDHLTLIQLTNLDLTSSSGIAYKVKFSKFLHILQFRNCILDTDYSIIFEEMINKAVKNSGKFYEIHIYPVQDHLAKLNDQFWYAPENFYSNVFRP